MSGLRPLSVVGHLKLRGTTEHANDCSFRKFPYTVKVKVKSLSRVRLFVTLSTVVYQAPPSMGFFRQEYWGGLSFPFPGESS